MSDHIPKGYENETPLLRPTSRYVADQAREMGLCVSDVIIGAEGRIETTLTLLYLGQRECVWHALDIEKPSKIIRLDAEMANWDLSCRHWYRVKEARHD